MVPSAVAMVPTSVVSAGCSVPGYTTNATPRMSAPIAIHSRVSMPRSSFRYPRILFITASPFSLTTFWGEESKLTAPFCCWRSVLARSLPPPSLLHVLTRPHLLRPHAREAAALQSQDHRRHLIPRNPEPNGSRLDHFQLVFRDLAEQARLLQHLEHQWSPGAIAVELDDDERFPDAHDRSPRRSLRPPPSGVSTAAEDCTGCATGHGLGRAGAEAMRYRCVASIPAGGACSR